MCFSTYNTYIYIYIDIHMHMWMDHTMSKPIRKSISGNDHPSTSYFWVPRILYIYISIRMYVYVYVHVYAYGPKTEVAKRYFFVAEVLDATLMMGWGGVGWGMLTFVWTCWGSWCYADDGVGWGGVGHANVRVNLLRFLMLRWWWGGVGWGGAC